METGGRHNTETSHDAQAHAPRLVLIWLQRLRIMKSWCNSYMLEASPLSSGKPAATAHACNARPTQRSGLYINSARSAWEASHPQALLGVTLASMGSEACAGRTRLRPAGPVGKTKTKPRATGNRESTKDPRRSRTRGGVRC